MSRSLSFFISLFVLSFVATRKLSDLREDAEKLELLIENLSSYFSRQHCSGDVISMIFKENFGEKIIEECSEKDVKFNSVLEDDMFGLSIDDEMILLRRYDFSGMYRGFPIYSVHFSSHESKFQLQPGMRILAMVENAGEIELNQEINPSFKEARFFGSNNDIGSLSVKNSKDDANYRISMVALSELDYVFYFSKVDEEKDFFNQGFSFKEAKYLMYLPPILREAPPSGPFSSVEERKKMKENSVPSFSIGKLVKKAFSVRLFTVVEEELVMIGFSNDKVMDMVDAKDFADFAREVVRVELEKNGKYTCLKGKNAIGCSNKVEII